MSNSISKGLNGVSANELQIGGQHYKEMGIQPWDVMEAVLTREEFIAWWTGEHAPLARTLPSVERIRFNVLQDGPFDGIAELWFP